MSHYHAIISVISPGDLVWLNLVPDTKVHGANMGPAWVLSSPGGPHVGPMNLAIWGYILWLLAQPRCCYFMYQGSTYAFTMSLGFT